MAPGQMSHDPVGRPLGHMSALKQVTGEAIYVDDMPPMAIKYIKRTFLHKMSEK